MKTHLVVVLVESGVCQAWFPGTLNQLPLEGWVKMYRDEEMTKQVGVNMTYAVTVMKAEDL